MADRAKTKTKPNRARSTEGYGRLNKQPSRPIEGLFACIKIKILQAALHITFAHECTNFEQVWHFAYMSSIKLRLHSLYFLYYDYVFCQWTSIKNKTLISVFCIYITLFVANELYWPYIYSARTSISCI